MKKTELVNKIKGLIKIARKESNLHIIKDYVKVSVSYLNQEVLFASTNLKAVCGVTFPALVKTDNFEGVIRISDLEMLLINLKSAKNVSIQVDSENEIFINEYSLKIDKETHENYAMTDFRPYDNSEKLFEVSGTKLFEICNSHSVLLKTLQNKYNLARDLKNLYFKSCALLKDVEVVSTNRYALRKDLIEGASLTDFNFAVEYMVVAVLRDYLKKYSGAINVYRKGDFIYFIGFDFIIYGRDVNHNNFINYDKFYEQFNGLQELGKMLFNKKEVLSILKGIKKLMQGASLLFFENGKVYFNDADYNTIEVNNLPCELTYDNFAINLDCFIPVLTSINEEKVEIIIKENFMTSINGNTLFNFNEIK